MTYPRRDLRRWSLRGCSLALTVFAAAAPPALAGSGSAPTGQRLATLLHEAAEAERVGEWSRAVDLLARARRLAPGRADVAADLGVALEGAGQPLEAVAAYREALALDPGSVTAAESLAALLASREDLEGALYVLTRALERRPDVANLHYHLALLLFRQEQDLSNRAVEHLEKARKLGFDRPHLYLLLGRVARHRDGAAAAVELLRRGLSRDPDDPELLREAGLALAALDDLTGAADALERVLRQEPGNGEVVAELARIYLSAGLAARVEDLLDRYGAEQDPNLLYVRAQAQRALGDPAASETLRRYRELMAREREEEEAVARALAEVRAGIVVWEEGDVAAAAAHFQRALKERAGWPLARSYLAAAYLAQGRTEAAEKIAESLLRAEPDNAQALMVLGRARLATAPGDALVLLERAVRLYPYRAVCLLTLAEAYLQLGRALDAESLLDRAEQIVPGDRWLTELRGRSRS